MAERPGIRVLVCGGRDFSDRERVDAALDRLHRDRGIAAVICGGANGADFLASQWAWSRGIENDVYKADWELHGKAAGPIRNQQMIDEGKPDGVVAFPGGRGTADMVERARKSGLKVWFPPSAERTNGERGDG